MWRSLTKSALAAALLAVVGAASPAFAGHRGVVVAVGERVNPGVILVGGRYYDYDRYDRYSRYDRYYDYDRYPRTLYIDRSYSYKDYPPAVAVAPPPVVVSPPPITVYPPPVVVAPPPVVVYQPRAYVAESYAYETYRPTSCGVYRYWDGHGCVDARWRRPYVGPRY
jgi:hypothetical protein